MSDKENRELDSTQEQHLLSLYHGFVDQKVDQLQVMESLGAAIFDDVDLLKDVLEKAIRTRIENDVFIGMELYWRSQHKRAVEKEFNAILLIPNHNQHQRMLKHLQDELKYPSSIEILDFLLTADFQKYFSPSQSEDGAIAQWFSYALYGIGTEKAIEVIRKHAKSSNAEISEEMKERLKMIEWENLEGVKIKTTRKKSILKWISNLVGRK